MVEIGAFTSAFGAIERPFDDIAGLDDLMLTHGIPLDLKMMGCGSFAQSDEPPEVLVAEAIRGSLGRSSLAPTEVAHVVFATSDNHLHQIGDDFARRVLGEVGLVNALPMLVSLQKCASSIAALDIARMRVEAAGGGIALLAAFDILGDDDAERVKSFALFGDGASCCVLSSGGDLSFEFDACRVAFDPAGMSGEDTFESRKAAATAALGGALDAAGVEIIDVEACFSTNFFRPISMFNAGLAGLPAARLALPTAAQRGHCGNADWMINLAAHGEARGFVPGRRYLAQAFAPGFSACAVFRARRGS